MKIFQKILLAGSMMLLANIMNAQSYIEVGIGLPIQQFEHSGAEKVGTDGLGVAFEIGYSYRFNRFIAALTVQYVITSDIFRDIDRPASPNYTGEVGIMRINPYLGYQFLIPLNREKTKKLAIEPSLGVARDILLSAEYSTNGAKITHEESNFFALSPTYGLRFGYQFTEHYSISLKTMFGHKIRSGNYEYYPSIYVSQPDALVKTHFSTVSVTIIRQL